MRQRRAVRDGAGRGRAALVRGGALAVLAWLVVALLLGHDAVMASRAAPPEPDHHAGREGAAPGDAPSNARGDDQAPPHPPGCDVGWEAAPRADGDGGPAPALPRPFGGSLVPAEVPGRATPVHPPPSARLRRALLQVYRI